MGQGEPRRAAGRKALMASHRAHALPFQSAERGASPYFSWKAFGWWMTGLLAVGAAVVVALHFTELSRIAEGLKHMNPVWLLPALAFQALSYVCAAGVWFLVARKCRARVNFPSLVVLSIGQVFARQAVPSGGVSGSLLVAKGFRNRGVPEDVAAACLMINMISFYAGYAAAMIVAMSSFMAKHALSHRIEAVGFGVLALAVAAPGAIWFLWRAEAKHRPRIVDRWKWLSDVYEALQQARGRMPRSLTLVLAAAACQFGVFVVDSATLFVVLKAFGPAPPPTLVFAAQVLANAVGTVAPVPLGLGAYEGACIYLLHRIGAPVETALTATLIFRGLTFWLPMLPGFFITRRELSR